MAEAKKDSTLTLTPSEKLTVIAAMELQQKSFERAARTNELMSKQAIAAAIRDELRQLVELKHKIDKA